MYEFVRTSMCLRRLLNAGGIGLLLLTGSVVRSQSSDRLDLPVVKPVIACDQLAKTDLSQAVGAPTSIRSATVRDTPKGQFCTVTGNIDPAIVFEVDLPVDHWTQRFIGNPSNASSLANAGGCAPALNGEFAVAFDNQGHSGGGMRDTTWTDNLQMRIDFAYRANHVTTLAAKALIKTFYGQPQRFAYFMGCSTGGWQSLTEAERYPEDFDGIAAGSPVLLDNVHNTFFHPWESYINKRSDGSRILMSSRMSILHEAVMAHCAAGAGVLDGVLQEPTACRFDPKWVQCAAESTDTSKCLTAEEVGVVENLYAGPGDGAGHHFEIHGFAMGTEHRWGLSTVDRVANPEAKEGFQLKRFLPPPESNKEQTALEDEFRFNQEWFDKLLALAPLWNAGNTNLRPYEEHGGKLILWNGAEDLTVQPEVSVAYYQGVQKLLGDKSTDSFMRLFIIPGLAHCGGGDIPFQLDLLTPLMAWTEVHHAPLTLMAGKPVPTQNTGRPGQGTPNAAVALASPGGGGGLGGPGGIWSLKTPLATPNRPNEFTRPIFPFPYYARYSGKGDQNEAASYERVKSTAPIPEVFDTEAIRLIGPDTQKFYHVTNGQLVPDTKQ